MKTARSALAVLALLALTTNLRASDADDIAALRAKIEAQAAQLEQLRAELARLEAHIRGGEAATPSKQEAAPPPALKFGGLLQGWYTAGDEGFNDTFRIRRAELRVSGELGKSIGWNVMIDPAKVLTTSNGAVVQSSRPLQDAFITVAGPRGATFQIGQYRVPLSREGIEPSSALDTIERALFLSDRARGAGYGDVRDIGVAVRGTLAGRYDYYTGIFNGSGESHNETDRNDRKTLIGRVVARAGGNFRVGMSGATGGPEKDGRPRRDRIGGELLYTRGAWKFAAEVMTGKDGATERSGYYLHGGYRFRPRLEGIVRLDGWDPDTSTDAGLAASAENDLILGLNFNVNRTMRFQVNLVHKEFEDEALAERNLLLMNLQTAW